MVPPHWNLLGCAVPTPLIKVKDGGFQHDENHATCRSKGKITLWTILSECFTMKFWEVSWHRFQNSRWQSSLRYYPINSRSPELQQPSPAEPDGIVPCQDRAAWGTVWLIFDMGNFACTTLMSFAFNRCIMAAVFCCS